MSGGSGEQRSEVPSGGEGLKDVVARVRRVSNDLPRPLPGSGGEKVLE